MLELINVKYEELSRKDREDLFFLRKNTFKDRLNWSVTCIHQMEYDEYDNYHTSYLLGKYQNTIICSVRFIDVKYNNMITGTFNKFFKKIDIPTDKYVEASRLFIDKKRVVGFGLNKHPLSLMLFLSMITYAIKYGFKGIYAIVTYQMFIIFKRSGWDVKMIDKGISNKNIYLIFMPVEKKYIDILIKKIKYY